VLAATRGRPGVGSREGRCHRRDRRDEPARDHAAVGPPHRAKPLGRAIVWQDRRTAERCAGAAGRRGRERAIRRATGLVCDPYFSATKLEWLLEHRAGRATPGEPLAGSAVRDGGQLAGVEAHRRCGARHRPQQRVAHDAVRPAFAALGAGTCCARSACRRACCPRCVARPATSAATRGVPGLPDGIAIAGVAGDQQAGTVRTGLRARRAEQEHVRHGCFLLLHTGQRAVASRAGLLTTGGVFGGRRAPRTRSRAVCSSGGAAIQWLRDGIGADRSCGREPSASHARCRTRAACVLVPAFAGLGAPYWRAGRARRAVRPDARQHALRTSCAPHSSPLGVPEPRPRRGHGEGCRRAA
jgi:glycerol kinase